MNNVNPSLLVLYAFFSLALTGLSGSYAHAQERKIDAGALSSIVSFLLQDDTPAADPASVSFAELRDNQVFEIGEQIRVEAILANVASAIERVELLINGESIRAERLAPYEWGNRQTQDPELFELAVGQHRLTLLAIQQDGGSFSATITINIVDPQGLSQVSLAVGQRIAFEKTQEAATFVLSRFCLLYTSPSPRD